MLKNTLNLGIIDASLPTTLDSKYYFYIDLANLLKTEYTSEAVEKFKQLLIDNSIKGKFSFDSEADGVTISSSKLNLLNISLFINSLANLSLTESEINDFKSFIKNYSPPNPHYMGCGGMSFVCHSLMEHLRQVK